MTLIANLVNIGFWIPVNVSQSCINDLWYWYTWNVSLILILILYQKCIMILDTLYYFCIKIRIMIHVSLIPTLVSTPRNFSKNSSSGCGTCFLIRENFTQLLLSVPAFSSFESSFLTLKLPSSKLSVFNIYRPPSSSKFSRPFSVFSWWI